MKYTGLVQAISLFLSTWQDRISPHVMDWLIDRTIHSVAWTNVHPFASLWLCAKLKTKSRPTDMALL